MKAGALGRITTFVAAVAVLSACGGGGATAPDTTPASVVLSNTAGSLVGGGTLQLSAVVKNAGGSVLTDKTVTYSSDKPTIAIVSSTGLVTAVGPIGSANIMGSAGAATSAPTVITVSAGAAQNIAKGTDLPLSPMVGSSNALTVKATDSFGNPVSGVAIVFGATAGGGSVSPTNATTDASGLAGTSFTLGNTVGTNTATATAAGLAGSPVTFSTASVVGPASSIVRIGTDPTSVVAGASFSDSVRVRVTDGLSNPKSGVSVAFAVTAGGGGVTPATVITDANGTAAAKFSTGVMVGTNTATATVAGLTAISFSIATIANPPTLKWSIVPSGSNANLISVWGSSASDVWAVGVDVGQGHNLLHYDGTSWSSFPAFQPALRGVWGLSSSDVWTVGGVGDFAAVFARPVWFNSGTVLQWTGGGLVSPVNQDLYGVWGTSASDVWAVGWGGTILHYNGTSWSGTPGITSRLFGVWGTSSSDVWAVGYAGVILHYNGASWSSLPSGTTSTLSSVWGSSASDVWVVGGRILHYNGTDWTVLNVAAGASGVWGTSASDVWAVGGGAILHYNGIFWSGIPSGTTGAANGVWGSSGSDVWVVGDGGMILHGTP